MSLFALKRIIAPHSFTSEHTVELHTHSGPALLSSILSSLALFPDLRPAQPGEFTKRALLNGRLDLTQVEGIKDLIDAETEEQRKSAVRAVGVGEETLPLRLCPITSHPSLRAT